MSKPYKRATPEEMAERAKVIAKLVDEGLTILQIAEKIGVGDGRIREQIKNTPGLKTPSEAHPNPRRLAGPVGALRPAITAQTDEFQRWLENILPEGTSHAEFIVSMAVDTYLDEMEAQQDAA